MQNPEESWWISTDLFKKSFGTLHYPARKIFPLPKEVETPPPLQVRFFLSPPNFPASLVKQMWIPVKSTLWCSHNTRLARQSGSIQWSAACGEVGGSLAPCTWLFIYLHFPPQWEVRCRRWAQQHKQREPHCTGEKAKEATRRLIHLFS